MENNFGVELCVNCYLRLKRYENLHVIDFQKEKTYYKNNLKEVKENCIPIEFKRGFKERSLDCLIYIFKYRGDIRKLILSYKFFNKYYLGEVFAKIILKNEKICSILKIYDIIIPVPMHKKKKKERGYNQAELFAESLAVNLKLQYDKNILVKFVNNKRQSSLSENERYKNIRNVFYVKKMEKIEGKKIVLVDDICTTSATLEECSRVLKNAGAKKVVAVVIAKD